MKQAILLIFLIAVSSCTDWDGSPTLSELEGKWVDQETKTDTLEFIRLEDGSALLRLGRGRELRNGYDLPKIGAGLYRFELKVKSISLHYSISSDSRFNEYFFEQRGSRLEIGRFYESENDDPVLTFKKID
jgi:hypothetical protein